MVKDISNVTIKKTADGGNSMLHLISVLPSKEESSIIKGDVKLYCGCGDTTSKTIKDLPTRGEIQMNCKTCGRTYEREYEIKVNPEVEYPYETKYLSDIRLVVS